MFQWEIWDEWLQDEMICIKDVSFGAHASTMAISITEHEGNADRRERFKKVGVGTVAAITLAV